MRVLALETSTLRGGVALLDGEEVIAEVVSDLGGEASRRLLPDVDAALAEAGWALRDLGLIAVSLGPGSFTGLRVGMATAKGLAWAAELPLAGVSSLEVLAAAAKSAPSAGGLISSVLDARRDEVYGALFRTTGNGSLGERLLPDSVEVPEQWAAHVLAAAGGEPVTFLGTGATRYSDVLPPGPGQPEHPPPSALARRALLAFREGRTLDPRSAVPNYVRSHGASPRGA